MGSNNLTTLQGARGFSRLAPMNLSHVTPSVAAELKKKKPNEFGLNAPVPTPESTDTAATPVAEPVADAAHAPAAQPTPAAEERATRKTTEGGRSTARGGRIRTSKLSKRRRPTLGSSNSNLLGS